MTARSLAAVIHGSAGPFAALPLAAERPPAGLERVSAADVMKAAQTYLRSDTAWKLEIRPKAAVAAADPQPKPN